MMTSVVQSTSPPVVVGNSTTTPCPKPVQQQISTFHLNITNSKLELPPHYTALIGKSLQLQLDQQQQRHHNSLLVEEVIAEGGFGVIFLVKHEHSKVKYALKRVVVNSERDYANCTREVAIMSTLSPKTPHILASLSHMVHVYPSSTYEIQNLMPLCKQNLLQVASARMAKSQNFTEQELLQVVHQVSSGLQYLHTSAPPIIHRDIKIENILMLDDLFVLSDFGSATTKHWDPASDSIQAIQEDLDKHTTLQYRSPEMVDLYGNRGLIGVASDIWAVGVCGFKLMCFKDPFESILAIQNRNLSWGTAKGKYSAEMVTLCETLMAEYQVVRPSVDEVIRIAGGGLLGDWTLLEDRVAKIREDQKGRENELSLKSSGSAGGNVVLETTVTPRQRPKRGIPTAPPGANGGSAVTTNAAAAVVPPPIGVTPAAAAVVLPPPLPHPKSPKPVSPGDTNSSTPAAPPPTRFFSPAHGSSPQLSTISPIPPPPPPHLTPSPSPQPIGASSVPQASWNPFDEDYQAPTIHQTQHCDNDSIQRNNLKEEDNDEDDPFAKAPFDYFKYQPIMVVGGQQEGGGEAYLLHNQQDDDQQYQYQAYYAPNNPFLYDVHSDIPAANNNINSSSDQLLAGVANLSFDDEHCHHVRSSITSAGSLPSNNYNNNNSDNDNAGGGAGI